MRLQPFLGIRTSTILFTLAVSLPCKGQVELSGYVDGTVIDSLSGVPISAQIILTSKDDSLPNRYAQAWWDGRFQFSDVVLGTYDVVASCDGWLSQSIPLSTVSLPDTNRIAFHLQQDTSLFNGDWQPSKEGERDITARLVAREMGIPYVPEPDTFAVFFGRVITQESRYPIYSDYIVEEFIDGEFKPSGSYIENKSQSRTSADGWYSCRKIAGIYRIRISSPSFGIAYSEPIHVYQGSYWQVNNILVPPLR